MNIIIQSEEGLGNLEAESNSDGAGELSLDTPQIWALFFRAVRRGGLKNKIE